MFKIFFFNYVIYLNYGISTNDYIFFYLHFLVSLWNLFGITKGFKAQRCGSFLEIKEHGCKDVVQRKNHAVEILEVKIESYNYMINVFFIKKDMHAKCVLIQEKYIFFKFSLKHILNFFFLSWNDAYCSQANILNAQF